MDGEEEITEVMRSDPCSLKGHNKNFVRKGAIAWLLCRGRCFSPIFSQSHEDICVVLSA